MITRGFFHCCLFDRHCLKMFWRYGAPLRLHLGERYWNVFPTYWRHKQVWGDAVELDHNPFAKEVSSDDRDPTDES